MGLTSLLIYNLVIHTVYSDRLMPNTVIAGTNVGGMTRSDAYQLVARKISDYQLNLIVGEKRVAISPVQLGVQYDLDSTIRLAYAQNRPVYLAWPSFNQERKKEVPLLYSFDASVAEKAAESIALRVSTPAVDASLTVENGEPVVTEGKDGVGVSSQSLLRQAIRALSEQKESYTFEVESIPPSIRASDVAAAAVDVKSAMSRPILFHHQGKVYQPTPAVIGTWLVFDPDARQRKVAVGVDPAKVKDYVESIARKINKAPVSRYVSAVNGVARGGYGGVEGISVDQGEIVRSVSRAIERKEPLMMEVPVKKVPYKTVYNETSALKYARYIEINLSQQRLWAYQNDKVVYYSAVTTGAKGAGMGTVVGQFKIYHKTTNTYLTGPGYRLHVDYWMPFYGHYGMHDAYWRGGRFGGQDYYYGGSHGCVNLPDATAAWLYHWSDIGTPVWVHY